MEQPRFIKPSLSNAANKRIILNDIQKTISQHANDMHIYKTHIKNRVVRNNPTINNKIAAERAFERAFFALRHEKKIKYTAYKPVILIESQLTCPCGSLDITDLTNGWGNNRLYKCLDCSRHSWKNVWWKQEDWIKHSKEAFKI